MIFGEVNFPTVDDWICADRPLALSAMETFTLLLLLLLPISYASIHWEVYNQCNQLAKINSKQRICSATKEKKINSVEKMRKSTMMKNVYSLHSSSKRFCSSAEYGCGTVVVGDDVLFHRATAAAIFYAEKTWRKIDTVLTFGCVLSLFVCDVARKSMCNLCASRVGISCRFPQTELDGIYLVYFSLFAMRNELWETRRLLKLVCFGRSRSWLMKSACLVKLLSKKYRRKAKTLITAVSTLGAVLPDPRNQNFDNHLTN